VPIAAALGVLGFGQLCLVAFGLGALGVLFDVAHYAYVPALVPRRELVASNSRIQVCYSVAGAAGPALGGALVGVVAAPFALVANAAAFLASALFLGRIRRPEAAPATPVGAAPSATTGIRFLLGHPLLRPIVLASMVLEAASGATVALFLFFLTRDLGTDPLLAGAVVALGGAAAVGGATAAPGSPAASASARRSSAAGWSPARRGSSGWRWPGRRPGRWRSWRWPKRHGARPRWSPTSTSGVCGRR
jgi:hypothetical protein